MPLTQGRIVGYDNERLAFRFTMLNGDETVNCQISDAAMDVAVGTEGSLYTVRQAQFSGASRSDRETRIRSFRRRRRDARLGCSYLLEAYSEVAECSVEFRKRGTLRKPDSIDAKFRLDLVANSPESETHLVFVNGRPLTDVQLEYPHSASSR
ncbi:hypothetical protein [Bradyrhizobium sp.]|uniref:hypothetical protein n=1 Tax=Bradyrhizobium sp. TaxID=376 RepID=UPI003BAF590A